MVSFVFYSGEVHAHHTRKREDEDTVLDHWPLLLPAIQRRRSTTGEAQPSGELMLDNLAGAHSAPTHRARLYLESQRERNTTAATASSPNRPAPPITKAQFPSGMLGPLVWLECPGPVAFNVGVGLGSGVDVSVGLDVGVAGRGVVVGADLVGCSGGVGVGVGVRVGVGAVTTVKGALTV